MILAQEIADLSFLSVLMFARHDRMLMLLIAVLHDAVVKVLHMRSDNAASVAHAFDLIGGDALVAFLQMRSNQFHFLYLQLMIAVGLIVLQIKLLFL